MKKKFIALSMLMFASSSHCFSFGWSSKSKEAPKVEAKASQSTSGTSAAPTAPSFFARMQTAWTASTPNSQAAPHESRSKSSSAGSELTVRQEPSSNSPDGRGVTLEIDAPESQDVAPQTLSENLSAENLKQKSPTKLWIEDTILKVLANQPKNTASARQQTNLERLNQQLNNFAHSAYKSIASLGKPETRQAFVRSVSAMFTNAGLKAPNIASFNAFFESLKPYMKMPEFTALFNKSFNKSTAEADQAKMTGIDRSLSTELPGREEIKLKDVPFTDAVENPVEIGRKEANSEADVSKKEPDDWSFKPTSWETQRTNHSKLKDLLRKQNENSSVSTSTGASQLTPSSTSTSQNGTPPSSPPTASSTSTWASPLTPPSISTSTGAGPLFTATQQTSPQPASSPTSVSTSTGAGPVSSHTPSSPLPVIPKTPSDRSHWVRPIFTPTH